LKPPSASHVEEIAKISGVNQTKRKTELYATIIEGAKKTQVDGTVKIYSHQDVG